MLNNILGLTDELIEKFRNAKNTVEFKREGEYWVLDTSSDITPNKSYKFKPLEEVVTTGPMGKGVKVKFTNLAVQMLKIYLEVLCRLHILQLYSNLKN